MPRTYTSTLTYDAGGVYYSGLNPLADLLITAGETVPTRYKDLGDGSYARVVDAGQNANRNAGVLHRSAINATDVLAVAGTLTLTAQTEAGSVLANVAYHVLVSAGNRWGNALVGADPGAITPTASQAIRCAFAQVTGAEWYDIFLSTAVNPLWVGRITEAQRAAGGFIISTVGTVTAGGGAPAGGVDLGAIGTGLASNVNPFAVNNAYRPTTVTPIACGGFGTAHLHIKLAVTDLRSLPTLVVTPFYQDQTSTTDWFQGAQQTLTFLTAAGQPLCQNLDLTVAGATGLVVLVQAITGQGAAVSIWVELS
jgi:hypothetical protein